MPYGDVNIINNDDLKSLNLKGPKFREPRLGNWHSNFINIMNSIEEYARRGVTHEKEDLTRCQNGLKIFDAG